MVPAKKLPDDPFNPIAPNCQLCAMNADAKSAKLSVIGQTYQAKILPAQTFSLAVDSLKLPGFGE